MEEIIIKPQPDSSIKKEIPLNLNGYTVFAGENNSGKTNLVKGIISEIGKDNVIYIPAENINAQEAVKVSSATDPMRDAISKLLNIVMIETPSIGGAFEDLFRKIEVAFNSFEIPNTNLELSSKLFKKSDFEKILKDAVAAKILDYKILDNYYDSETSLGFNSVGQGIQRLIISTIIQEIGKTRISKDKLIILFEEPEIYLHPKLKEKLYNSLFELSEQPNVNIIITTHDPYFIELSKDKNIYQVTRDSDGATKVDLVENKSLPEEWKSFAEINYKVFGVNSENYLNELYGYLEFKGVKVDDELVKKESQEIMRKHSGDKKITMTTYIRHEIHHKTNEHNYEPDDVEIGISNLQDIITEKEY